MDYQEKIIEAIQQISFNSSSFTNPSVKRQVIIYTHGNLFKDTFSDKTLIDEKICQKLTEYKLGILWKIWCGKKLD